MRRYIMIRLIMCVSVLVCLHFAAFFTYASETHSCADGRHEYESRILHINTEYEDGQVENTCVRCGHSYIEILPATGHTFGEWEVIKEATNTETGLESRQCTDCNRVYERVIPVVKTTVKPIESTLVANLADPPAVQPKPNAMDYVLVGSISGVWAYTFLMLWYNGLVINWDKRERLKKRKGKRN